MSRNHLRLILLTTIVTTYGCSIAVKDLTATPVTPSTPNTTEIPVSATITLGLLTTDPQLSTTATFTPGNAMGNTTIITMQRAGAPPTYTYNGALTFPTWWGVEPAAACGFTMNHYGKARFFGIFPITATAQRFIEPNRLYQGLILNGTDGNIRIKMANVTKITTTSVPSDSYLSLFNYTSNLTVTAIRVLCTAGVDCTTTSTPSLSNIQLPTVPVNLACGASTTVRFVCSAQSDNQCGTVEFTTSLGTITVPIIVSAGG
jgi:hypothetical protein